MPRGTYDEIRGWRSDAQLNLTRLRAGNGPPGELNQLADYREGAEIDHGFVACLTERHGKRTSDIGSDDSNGHDPVLPGQLAVLLLHPWPDAAGVAEIRCCC